jgi:heat shock protein HtpX
MPGRRVPDPSLLRTHPETDDRIERLLALVPRPRRQPPLTLHGGGWPESRTPQPAARPRYRPPGLWY